MSDMSTWGEGKGAGAVMLTGGGRFWSNGLDYGSAMKNPRFFEGQLGDQSTKDMKRVVALSCDSRCPAIGWCGCTRDNGIEAGLEQLRRGPCCQIDTSYWVKGVLRGTRG
jgi:hypothetical protein